MNKIVIGLIGAKRAGKDTSAEIITGGLIDGSEQIALADKLRVELSIAYDIDYIHFIAQELKEEPFLYPLRTTIDRICHMIDAFAPDTGTMPKIPYLSLLELASVELKSPRDLMQHWGMFLRSIYGADVHCNQIELFNDVTVISDIRFKNEFDYFKNLQGVTFIPLYIENLKAESVAKKDSHESERGFEKLKKSCIRIDNNDKNIYTLAKNLSDALGSVLND